MGEGERGLTPGEITIFSFNARKNNLEVAKSVYTGIPQRLFVLCHFSINIFEIIPLR